MKKMTVLRTILSLTLTAFLLCGCGNSEAAAPVEEVPEVTEEQVTEEPKEEVQQPAEEETAEEEVVEEPEEEETPADMPEAQVTTTASEVGGLLAYMESLDPQKPAIVIYSEKDGGTIINMQEGQHYSLKEGDKIIVNECWDVITSSKVDTNIVSNEFDTISDCAVILHPDYTKFGEKQKFFYAIRLKNDPDKELHTITCYLDAPAE